MRILAVSGVKNSGKTTLICALLDIFSAMGMKVAVIKHDGHDFEPDVPGTDSFRHRKSGAYGTAVFSAQRYMVTRQQAGVTEQDLMTCFPEADLILLEGFKHSAYPKIEVVRRANAHTRVCREAVLAVASDIPPEEWPEEADMQTTVLLDLNRPEQVAEFILHTMWEETV